MNDMTDDRTLYCFKVKDSGELMRIQVNNYHTSRDAYVWKLISGYTKYTYKRNIDKVCHGEVCSFNSSFEHALHIFLSSLDERARKAYKQYEENNNTLQKLKKYYLDNTGSAT